MRITHHPSKPLTWWHTRRAMIDLDPPYQRKGRLWSTADKAYLIDSIINGFDVPKLYFADFQYGESALNQKQLPYAIIDGKQRLEAIFDFFDGKLVLNSDFIYRLNPKLSLGGLSLRDLRENYATIAERFESETIDVMSVVASHPEEINELFVRLNRSKPLTGAEIRNAMNGPVPQIIRNVAKHPFFQENIKFNTQRAGDYNAAAKIVLFEYQSKPVSTKKKDLDNFAASREIDFTQVNLAGRRAVDVLDVMQEIFLPKDELLASAGPLPVYFWLVRDLGATGSYGLREFLVKFERDRAAFREAQLRGVQPPPNDVFSKYDALSRSTNDVGSHTGRVSILLDGFNAWKARYKI